MKKLILPLTFGLFILFSVQSQNVKYITTAPDGSTALTITDNSTANILQLESATDFYKYQILDKTTGEAIYSAFNRGKHCSIDTSKISKGRYNLRLFTRKFIITSEIPIGLSRLLVGESTLAMIEN